MKPWYKIEAKKDRAEIWIYEPIGQDMWSMDGVTAKSFQKELSSIKSKEIDLHINSPGGSVFDGFAIYNQLVQHPATVTTYIDGLAASIASVIALAGDRIIMAGNALMMVHNPSGMSYGTSEDMRKMADTLDTVRDSMLSIYTARTGKTDQEIITLLDAETWMSAEDAMQHGFIDEVSAEMRLAAMSTFAPTMKQYGYKNAPKFDPPVQEPPDIRACERALRSIGVSQKEAKRIMAEGFREKIGDAKNIKRTRTVSDLLVAADHLASTS